MKEKIILAVIFSIIAVLFSVSVSEAHPGRTASDGCHYCRTNCDSWGVPWNERHCHGSSYSPPPTYVAPKPAPLILPSSKPEEKKNEIIKYNDIARETTATVHQVVDGDTIKVSFPDGAPASATIRFLGIDTPESKDPRKPVQCFSKEATEYLESLIGNKDVKLISDPAADNRDKYSRLLRYIHIGGEDVNLKMVKDGYAYALLKYPMSEDKKKEYKAAEDEARKEKRGLWAEDTCNGGREFLPKKEVAEQTTAQENESVSPNKPDESSTVSDSNYEEPAEEKKNLLEKIIAFLKRLFGF